jgi:hypothetical protein
MISWARFTSARTETPDPIGITWISPVAFIRPPE